MMGTEILKVDLSYMNSQEKQLRKYSWNQLYVSDVWRGLWQMSTFNEIQIELAVDTQV